MNTTISKPRLKAIMEGAEPTYEEKQILTDQLNYINRLKYEANIRKANTEERRKKAKEDIELAKTNKNKRRNLRKKLRRS